MGTSAMADELELPSVLRKIRDQFDLIVEKGNVGQYVADRMTKASMKQAGGHQGTVQMLQSVA